MRRASVVSILMVADHNAPRPGLRRRAASRVQFDRQHDPRRSNLIACRARSASHDLHFAIGRAELGAPPRTSAAFRVSRAQVKCDAEGWDGMGRGA